MITTLTDRYVAATLKHLPRQQQAEIELELRTAIADEIDSRVSAGQKPADAEYLTLRNLGDPGQLAARYAGGRQVLIGARTYQPWSTVMRLSLTAVLPIVFIVLVTVYAVNQHDIWITIFRPVGITLTVGTFLFTITTAVFALAEGHERRPEDHAGLMWTPDRLRDETVRGQ